ncbi:hypothetical protein ACFSZS_04300 [Seohaeicola zhoushanensis]
MVARGGRSAARHPGEDLEAFAHDGQEADEDPGGHVIEQDRLDMPAQEGQHVGRGLGIGDRNDAGAGMAVEEVGNAEIGKARFRPHVQHHDRVRRKLRDVAEVAHEGVN